MFSYSGPSADGTVSVLVCANAVGNVLPNTFLLKDNKDRTGCDMTAALRAFDDFGPLLGPTPGFITTPHGKVTKESMLDWFFRLFDRQARHLYAMNHGRDPPSNSKTKLGMLILDWAPAHVADEVRKTFQDSQWVVHALVPGSTHIMQPLESPRPGTLLQRAATHLGQAEKQGYFAFVAKP